MTFAEIRNNQTLKMILQRSWLVVVALVFVVPFIVVGMWEGAVIRFNEFRRDVVYFWNEYGLTDVDHDEDDDVMDA